MPNAEIEEFAKILIQQVRDAAIRECDRQLRGDDKGPVAKRWSEKISADSAKSIVDEIIPDIVDATLARLLLAIDQELLPLSFTTLDGKTIDLIEDGSSELCGWYMGSDGWRAQYSKERFIDDFSDLS